MTIKMRIVLAGAVFIAGLNPAACFAQSSNSPTPLTINPEGYVVYPSMEPVTVIEVQLSGTEVNDALTRAGWNCGQTASVGSYRVTAFSGQKSKDLQVTFVDTELTCKTSTFSPGSVKLHLRAALQKNDQVQVTLQNLGNGVQIQSSQTTLMTGTTPVVFTATPQAAPNESLINGKSRDTGQLSVSFSDTSLTPALPVDLYLKSTDLF